MTTVVINRPTNAPSASGKRLLSVDVLRGLTVAAMILVTDPGTYDHRFPVLCHADWNGPTVTDLIFPSFLLTVGVSMVLSFTARVARGVGYGALAGHSLRRSLWLIFLGLLLNGFPFYHLHTLPIPGILQLIAGAYLPAALLYLVLLRSNFTLTRRTLALLLTAFGALAVYWALLKLYPTPGFGPGRLDTLGSLPAVVDRIVFTPAHMWAYGLTPGYGVTYDPNGLLLLLPTFATVLFGALAAEILQSPQALRKQCGALAVFGTTLWLLGFGLSPWLVLNKKLWTSTFAMFSSGLALLTFAALVYLIDVRGLRRGWTIALIFGTNAIFAFALSAMMTTLLIVLHGSFRGHSTALHTVLYEQLFAMTSAPRFSSLMYAVAIVMLNAALIYPLYRRRVFLRL